MLLNRFKRLAVLSLSCLLVLTGWTSSGHAAPLEDASSESKVEWDKKFGDSNASFRGRSVIPTLEGGYVAVGEISRKAMPDPEGFVVKVDENGDVEWEQRLQTTGDLYIDGVETYQIIQARDGGYLVSGASTDRSEKPRTIPYLAKLDDRGNVEWSRPYHDLSVGLYQYGHSVAETPDGGFVVTGRSVSSSGDAPAYLFKVDGKGNKLWYKWYYPNDNEYFKEVITTPDGGILAVGNIDSFISPDFDASVIVKLNSQGEVEWEKRQTAPRTGRTAHSVQLSEDGGYIVSGAFRQNGKWTTFVMKTDDRGETIWERQYPSGGDGGDESYSQLKTTEDGYALIGYSSRGNYPESILQYQILRLDHDGEIIGKLHYAAPGLAGVGKGAPTADGGFILSGRVKEGESYRMQLVKLGSGMGETPGDRELAELRFSDKTLKLGVGERQPSVLEAVYTDGSVTDVTYLAGFTSLNPEVANVDHAGVITGISAGIAEITGEYGGRRAVLSVSVHDGPGEPQPAPRGFHLDSNDYSVTVGDELDIQAFFMSEDGKAVNVTGETRFTTADPGVAEIDEYGNITGLRPGLTTITAYYEGYSYTSSLLVVRPYTPGSQGESGDSGLTEA